MRPMKRFWFALRLSVLCLSTSLSPALAQVQPPGTMVRLNHIDVHYRTLGSGEPLLLPHGFGGCGDDWQPFSQALASSFR